MKKYEKEYKHNVVYYEADDGKIFNDAEKCRQYEESEPFKIKMKLFEFLVRKVDVGQLFSPFDIGNEETSIIVRPRNHEDIETLNDYLSMDSLNGRIYKRYEYVDDSYIGKNVVIMGYYNKHPYILEDMAEQLDKCLKEILSDDECDADYDEEQNKVVRNYKF